MAARRPRARSGPPAAVLQTVSLRTETAAEGTTLPDKYVDMREAEVPSRCANWAAVSTSARSAASAFWRAWASALKNGDRSGVVGERDGLEPSAE